MRSTDVALSRDGQRGVSLIEAVVASALLGLGVVTGLTAWDTSVMSAQQAISATWARCMVRGELNAILAAPLAGSYASPDANLQVQVSDVPNRNDADDGTSAVEQEVTVTAVNPRGGSGLTFGASALKVRALQGSTPVDTAAINAGCPAP